MGPSKDHRGGVSFMPGEEKDIKYFALKEGKVLAEAPSLSELAARIREMGVEARGLRILRSKSFKSIARGGYRLKGI